MPPRASSHPLAGRSSRLALHDIMTNEDFIFSKSVDQSFMKKLKIM